jgi:hypothetical protein
MQTQPVTIRERDIVYQYNRIVSMAQLIRAYPASSRHLMDQAVDDVPPLVRSAYTTVSPARPYMLACSVSIGLMFGSYVWILCLDLMFGSYVWTLCLDLMFGTYVWV